MESGKPKPFTMRGTDTIKFRGGGEVRFAYNQEGKLMEFTAKRIGAEILNGDRILLKRAVK